MIRQGFTDVTFTVQYPVNFCGARYETGEEITVGLVRNWDEDEGQGEGGPWGWGGYPSRLIAELAGDIDLANEHTHTCPACGKETAFGRFDCEQNTDHAFALCDACAAAGVKL